VGSQQTMEAQYFPSPGTICDYHLSHLEKRYDFHSKDYLLIFFNYDNDEEKTEVLGNNNLILLY